MTKAARSRRRLGIWSALPPYLGGKRRLCPLIFREIDRVLPRRLWAGRKLLDGFLGGGSVSLYAKAQGFNVTACDIAERALVTGRALIENSRVKLTREDVIRILTPNPEPAMRVEREMSPSIFTANVARFIDRCLAASRVTEDPAKAALLRMLAVRIGLLEHPMSQVRKGTIHRVTTGEYEAITSSCVHHYVDGFRLTRLERVWQLAEQINAGVFQGDGRVLQGSVLELLPTIDAAVAYFDPPYPGVMSYEKEYRVIDEILEGQTRPTSPFTAKDGAAMIDGLFERAQHIPVWLLSLGNAVATLDELEGKMTKLGRVTKAIEIKYTHLPSIATQEKNEGNREFLVVGWDPSSPLLRSVSVAGIGNHDLGQVPHELMVGVGYDPDGLGPEGPASLARRGDPEQEGKPRFTGKPALVAGRDAIAELQDGIDTPDPVDVKRAVNGGREVWSLFAVGHDTTIPPLPPEIKC